LERKKINNGEEWRGKGGKGKKNRSRKPNEYLGSTKRAVSLHPEIIGFGVRKAREENDAKEAQKSIPKLSTWNCARRHIVMHALGTAVVGAAEIEIGWRVGSGSIRWGIVSL